MSQAEDDAPLLGDALAELVEAGKITDLEAMAYLSGSASRATVLKIMEAMEEVYGK